jgi:hypothetical protein
VHRRDTDDLPRRRAARAEIRRSSLCTFNNCTQDGAQLDIIGFAGEETQLPEVEFAIEFDNSEG